MVVNALLRGGAQINFWQSKNGKRGDARLLLNWHLTSDATKEWTVVGLTKQLDQHHQVLWLFQSSLIVSGQLNALACSNKPLLLLERPLIGRHS
jgi:hypothetical protein